MSLVQHGNGFMGMSFGIWSIGVVWALCGMTVRSMENELYHGMGMSLSEWEWVCGMGMSFVVWQHNYMGMSFIIVFLGAGDLLPVATQFLQDASWPGESLLLVTWLSHDYHMIPSSLMRVLRKPENMKLAQSSCLLFRRDLTFRKNSRTFTFLEEESNERLVGDEDTP